MRNNLARFIFGHRIADVLFRTELSQTNTIPIGDKSPKSKQKDKTQKQSKTDSAASDKKQAIANKQKPAGDSKK